MFVDPNLSRYVNIHVWSMYYCAFYAVPIWCVWQTMFATPIAGSCSHTASSCVQCWYPSVPKTCHWFKNHVKGFVAFVILPPASSVGFHFELSGVLFYQCVS